MRHHKLSQVPASSVGVTRTRNSIERRLTVWRADDHGSPSGTAQLEELRRLAERVIRDAEDVAAKINKAAGPETTLSPERTGEPATNAVGLQQQSEEAARRKASLILEEARQKAVAIVAEATREAAQARLMAKEDIERHLTEVMGKIRNELRPSLDFMVGRAKILEEGMQTFAAAKDESHISESHITSHPSREFPDPGFGSDRKSDETKGSKDPNERQYLERCPDNNSHGETTVGGSELLEGKVEIKVAPPVDMVRLLGMTRYLEGTRNIKVTQTSGSWDRGSVITISVDKPLPLVDLLRRMPGLGEASLAAEQIEPPGTGQRDVKSILVTLKNK